MTIIRGLSSLVLMFALLPASIQAKTNLSDWTNVRRVKTGTSIVVSTKMGDVYAGDLKQADDDSLVLLVRVSDVMRKAVELRKNDVYEVRRPKRRMKPLLIGAAIGAGAGIGVGAIYDASHPFSDDPGIGKALFGFLGGLMGTAAGGAFSLKGKKIYVAP